MTLPETADGPLDLTDAGIRMQVDTNNQDRYGDCVTLSTLMGIARDNPDFVRQHMAYDPATKTYRVTLYDKMSGAPIVVTVDPANLPVQGSDRRAQAR